MTVMMMLSLLEEVGSIDRFIDASSLEYAYVSISSCSTAAYTRCSKNSVTSDESANRIDCRFRERHLNLSDTRISKYKLVNQSVIYRVA